MISLRADKNCQELSKLPSEVQQRIIKEARKETRSFWHGFVGVIMSISVFTIYVIIQPSIFPSFPLNGPGGVLIAGALGGIYGLTKTLYDKYYYRKILQSKIEELTRKETIDDNKE